MKTFDEQEIELSNLLKKKCDCNGVETSPYESAPIFHQMGLLYQTKSPDKINLIQSAALLNAAIARQLSNVQFQTDLDELCSHVLVCANAEQKQVKLREISLKVAQKVEELRTKTNAGLQNIENIPDNVKGNELFELEKQKVKCVQSLQNEVAERYTNVMKYISEQCVGILGQSPCQYTLIGMGSLAKQEITPYSDFEHIIVLDEFTDKQSNQVDKIMEYFRWYSVIFHIIVLNLKETIIPSVGIPSLNDSSKPNGDWFFDSFTTRGISFDGMMPHACKFPLGRTQTTKNKNWTTELIKPLSEMVKYLEVSEDLKNGYKLADVLTRTCFVSGNVILYNWFSICVEFCLQKNKRFSLPLLLKQLENDMQQFDLIRNLDGIEFAKKLNIKRLIYRSATLFVSALGRFHSINKCSSFQIIEELKSLAMINNLTAIKLSYAIAIACQVRLVFYMKQQSQDDNVSEGNMETDNLKVKQLIQAVGTKSLVDYFVVARCLQTSIQTGFHVLSLNAVMQESQPVEFVKFEVMNDLRLFDQIIIESEEYFNKHPQDEHEPLHLEIMYYIAEAFRKTGSMEESLKMFEKLELVANPGRPNWTLEMTTHKLYNLHWLNRFMDVIDQVKGIKSRCRLKMGQLRIYEMYQLADVMFVEALSLREEKMFNEALSSLRDVLNMLSQTTSYRSTFFRVGQAKKQVALNLCDLRRFDQALCHAYEAREIFIKDNALEGYITRCDEIILQCKTVQGNRSTFI